MHKKLLTLLVAVLGLFAFATRGFTQAASPSPTPAPSTATPVRHAGQAHHPAIRAAIRSLERAKAEMQAANHDFGGHRADALAACDAAIAQLQLALQYARGTAPAVGTAPTPTPTP
jgi:hypothetical protein